MKYFYPFIFVASLFLSNITHATELSNINQVAPWLNCYNLAQNYYSNTNMQHNVPLTIENCESLLKDNPFRNYVMGNENQSLYNLKNSYLVTKNAFDKQRIIEEFSRQVSQTELLDINKDFFIEVYISMDSYNENRNGVPTQMGWKFRNRKIDLNLIDTFNLFCPNVVLEKNMTHPTNICLSFEYQNLNDLPFSFLNISKEKYEQIKQIYPTGYILGFYKVHINQYKGTVNKFDLRTSTYLLGPVYQTEIKDLYIFNNKSGEIISHISINDTLKSNFDSFTLDNQAPIKTINFEETKNQPLVINLNK